jgi:hypothetical protein
MFKKLKEKINIKKRKLKKAAFLAVGFFGGCHLYLR